MTLRLHHLRRHALFAVLLAGLLVVSLSGADAKTAPKTTAKDAHGTSTQSGAGQRKAVASGLTPDEKKYLLPTPDPDPKDGSSNFQAPYGGPVNSTTVVAGRAKAQLTVGATTALAYERFCSDLVLGSGLPDVQTCCPGSTADANCPADAVVRPPATSADDSGTVSWNSVNGPVWVKSAPGSSRPFGVFAPTQVKLLAFGSLPATATIHLAQPVGDDGFVAPLQFRQLTLQANGFTGPVTVAGFGGTSPTGDDNFTFYQIDRLGGPVDIRIDNLTVDGHRIDVGSSCRTVSPAQLQYSGPKGWLRLSADSSSLYGQPGGFQPLGDNTGNSGAGVALVNIPSFSGCRDGRGSLDRLVTSLASGPDNFAKLTLGQPLKGCVVPGTDPGSGYLCPTYPGDPLRAGATTTSASAKGGALAPARAARAARIVYRLPARSRNLVLNSLPAEARAQLRQARR